MIEAKSITNLDDYYAYVQNAGKLLTKAHARRWSRGVLNMLGVNLDRGTKKELAAALPEELAEALTEVFWLAHFRNNNLTSYEFQNRVARRSGNTDPDFARYPVLAVFGGVKALINEDVSRKVSQSLSPELREMWDAA